MILVMLATLLGGTTISAQAASPAGRYIVVFKGTVDAPGEAPRMAEALGLQLGFVYKNALKGMSVVVPAGRLANLQRDPRVAYVVEDFERSISAQTVPTGIKRIFAETNPEIAIDGSDDYRVDVDVAVIDTGVDFQHPDLNVAGGVNCTSGWFRASCRAGGDDDHYHGTHVAGIIGAIDNGIGTVGVAPGARIWAVKVLNSQGSGYSSWVIAGIDWVAANAATIEVANMSLSGSGYSQAEYDAIQGAVNKGVAFAVAAGNNDADANNYSPAAYDNVLTASALADFDGASGGFGGATCRTDQDDTLADFSNWGNAVDITAPGVCILSTYPLEQGEYGAISGTSMASPHVAGALALLASANNPANATDVYNLYAQVKSAGNFSWVDDSGDGIQESLLDVSNTAIFSPVLVAGSGGGGGGGNTPPTVSISNPANGANFVSGTSITFSGSASDDQDGDLTGSLAWTSSIDGPIRTGGSFSVVLSNGTHTITASITDAGGATGTATITVTVAPTSQITLSVRAYKRWSTKYAELTWSGATYAKVDVYRGGTRVTTTANDGAYTDRPSRSTTSATYKVCEAGTNTCSNDVTVTW